MSNPERIYALLVEANPVPDPEALPDAFEERSPHLQVVDPRRDTMQTEERQTTLGPRPRRPRRRLPLIAAGLAVIVALVAVVVLLQPDDSTAPTEPLPAPEELELPTLEEPDPNAAAEAKMISFFAALNARDLGTVATLSRPDGVLDEADRNLWEWDAAFTAAGYRYEPTACDAVPDAPEANLYVTVRCSMSYSDPVTQAAGADREFVWPWWVWHNGRMDWQSPDGDNPANGIYADYLKAHNAADYETACNPAPYFGSGTAIHDDQGIAFTENCAGLVVPLLDDIAQWVKDGRPAP